MIGNRRRGPAFCLVLLPLALSALPAQAPPPGAPDGEPAAQELREAFRRRMEERIRALRDEREPPARRAPQDRPPLPPPRP